MKKLTIINPVILVMIFLTAYCFIGINDAMSQLEKTCPGGHKDDENIIVGRIVYNLAAGRDTFATEGTVKLFKVNPPGTDVIAVDSARINSFGYYSIFGFPQGDYYIVAYPGDKVEDYMVSFYPSGQLWSTATKIVIPPGKGQVRTCNIRSEALYVTTGATPVQGETADSANHNYKLKNSIIIARSGGQYKGFAITNNQGKYLINSIAPGSHTITASRFGYKNFSQLATVTSAPLTINFYMSRDTASNSISVNPNETVIKNFKLMQNFPNPFNPSTEIVFSLEKGMNIKLAVYSIEGKIVKELISGYRREGEYKVNFSADNLSSGIYNYVLETESGLKESKRMVFTK